MYVIMYIMSYKGFFIYIGGTEVSFEFLSIVIFEK